MWKVSSFAWAIQLTVSSLCGPSAAFAAPADRLVVSCSPDKPVVFSGESIQVRAWAESSTGRLLSTKLTYAWKATGGRIRSQAAEAFWDFKEARAGEYKATVSVAAPSLRAADCSIQVFVESGKRLPGLGERGGSSQRETGRSFLVAGQREKTGYGLYSYLLFGSPPTDASRERYLKAIEAYLSLVLDISGLEKYFAPSELNITYLPINASLPENLDAKALSQWVVEHYDYARARFLLKAISGGNRDGPYIVSALTPLSGSPAGSGHLEQDLSQVPPQLARSWVKEFLNQVSQEHFWEARTLPQVRLKIRTTIAILAAGLPEVQKSLDGWIKVSR